MLQVIHGVTLYVVDFDTMPNLPVIGRGEEEPYARALTDAITTGIITEPGKYGISITPDANRLDYNIWSIKD